MSAIETVALSEVIAANEECPKKAYTKLIEEAGALQAKFVPAAPFKEALETHECIGDDCSREVNEEGMRCTYCGAQHRRDERARRLVIELQDKWEVLLEGLNRLSPRNSYKAILNQHGNISYLRREDEHGNYCELYRDSMMSGSSWHSSGNAVRIRTNDYDRKAMLRADLGRIKVPKMHERCTKLLKEIQEAIDSKKRQSMRENAVQNLIRKTFPILAANPHSITQDYYRSHGSPRSRKTGSYSFTLKKVTVITWDGIKYGIRGIISGASADQIRSIVDFIADIRESNEKAKAAK